MIRDGVGRAKHWLLRKRYAVKYRRLDPPDYSADKFASAAEGAYELLKRLKRELPPLPPDALQPYWREGLEAVDKVLERPLKPDFFQIPAIQAAMVRRGWTTVQEHEIGWLRGRRELYERAKRGFRESRIGGPYLECTDFGCSSASLGYLYYLGRIQKLREEAGGGRRNVVELGGGFGGFCKVYCWSEAPKRYTIIDLPQFSAIQYLFLSLSLADMSVTILRSASGSLETGIRLLPVNLLFAGGFTDPGCLFTSHFALTEAGDGVRKRVYAGQFFGAEEVYYVGQQSKRWAVSVDPEVEGALSETGGFQAKRGRYHMQDCTEIYARRKGHDDR